MFKSFKNVTNSLFSFYTNKIKVKYSVYKKNKPEIFLKRFRKACNRSWEILMTKPYTLEKFLRWEKNHVKILRIAEEKVKSKRFIKSHIDFLDGVLTGSMYADGNNGNNLFKELIRR